MSRSAGPGQPSWFQCSMCRRNRTKYPVTLTGRQRPYKVRGIGGRMNTVALEYRCGCGHVGWSAHVGLADPARFYGWGEAVKGMEYQPRPGFPLDPERCRGAHHLPHAWVQCPNKAHASGWCKKCDPELKCSEGHCGRTAPIQEDGVRRCYQHQRLYEERQAAQARVRQKEHLAQVASQGLSYGLHVRRDWGGAYRVEVVVNEKPFVFLTTTSPALANYFAGELQISFALRRGVEGFLRHLASGGGHPLGDVPGAEWAGAAIMDALEEEP